MIYSAIKNSNTQLLSIIDSECGKDGKPAIGIKIFIQVWDKYNNSSDEIGRSGSNKWNIGHPGLGHFVNDATTAEDVKQSLKPILDWFVDESKWVKDVMSKVNDKEHDRSHADESGRADSPKPRR